MEQQHTDISPISPAKRPYGAALMAGCASLALIGPVVAGSAAAARFAPTTVDYAPGLSADVSLLFGEDTATIATGALGSLHIPGISHNLPVIGSVSPLIQVNEIGVKLDAGSDTFTQYSFLAKNYQDMIIEPTEEAIKDRLLAGAAAGAAVDIALIGGFVLYRRRQYKKAGRAAAIQDLRDESASNPELLAKIDAATGTKHTESPRRHVSGRSILLGTAMASTVLTACALDTIPVSRISGPGSAVKAPLDSSVTDRLPVLHGATVTGLGGDAINTAIDRIEKEVVKTDKMWNKAVTNLDEAFYTYTGGLELPYKYDPDIVPVMQVSDIHCNYAYMQKIFDQLVRKFQVQLVLNTGDTYMTTGSLPLESDCLPELLEQMNPDNQGGRKVVMLYVRGNHDPMELPDSIVDSTVTTKDGEKFSQIVVLDTKNGYTATEQDITFVGAPDPNKSDLQGTHPVDGHEQDGLIQKQGQTIADAACQVREETGIPPLIAAHHPEALYESIAHGCGDVFSGHTHRTTGPIAYQTLDGRIVHERVLGSSGGAPMGKRSGITITQYAVPTSDSVSSIELVNKKTGQVEKSILVTITSEAEVTIQEKLPPSTATPVAENPDLAPYNPVGYIGFP